MKSTNIKKQFDNIEAKLSENNTALEKLLKDEKVQQYIKTKEKNASLKSELKELYKDMKFEEYSSCDHMCLISKHVYDSVEGRSYNFLGCVKCGLDQSFYHRLECCYGFTALSDEEQIMYDYISANNPIMKIDIDVVCDLESAKRIYSTIKKQHPNDDDKTIADIFKETYKEELKKEPIVAPLDKDACRKLEFDEKTKLVKMKKPNKDNK